MNELSKGNIVMIYEDPLTENRPEGKAKLIKRLADKSQVEYWKVHFETDTDKSTYDRYIKRRDDYAL